MRPELVAWLEARGIFGWLAPDYLVLAGLGALCAGAVSLQLMPKEHRAIYAKALFAAYVCTYLGGHLFEGLRAIPAALSSGDLSLVYNSGRAAWGGLLGSIAGGAYVVRKERVPIAPFFDGVAVGVGIVFAFVRVGCFLGGCDFGAPTAGVWGVRFPPGSFAAIAHVQEGWISSGHASLPVHATQLYEAGFGAVSAGFIYALARARVFEGRRFLVWILAYCVFRFGNELLRGDADRGVYGGLSSAQLVSVLVASAVLLLLPLVQLRLPRDLARVH